jgi:hypothetical protein
VAGRAQLKVARYRPTSAADVTAVRTGSDLGLGAEAIELTTDDGAVFSEH